MLLATVARFLACSAVAAAWYLPMIAPVDYTKDELVPVYVNRLTGAGHSLEGVDYYDPRLPFCSPSSQPQKVAGSLGSVLLGDRLYTSVFEVHMLEDVECAVACIAEIPGPDAAFIEQLISEQFRQHWLVDGLPVVGASLETDGTHSLEPGFLVGSLVDINDNEINFMESRENTAHEHKPAGTEPEPEPEPETVTEPEPEPEPEPDSDGSEEDREHLESANEKAELDKQLNERSDETERVDTPVMTLDKQIELSKDRVALYNHFEITLDYHEVNGKFRVVGAIVEPSARNAVAIGTEEGVEEPYKCGTDRGPFRLHTDPELGEQLVTFSYSVQWRHSSVPWATRWDHYLQARKLRVNWYTLLNSSVLAFSFSTVCVLSFMRILRKDISAYNELSLDAHDIALEKGWKLVSNDVFRAPRNSLLFSALVGSGVQILSALAITLTLAAIGLVSPANRGSIPTALLLLGSLLSAAGGYFSARVYKTWSTSSGAPLQSSNWKKNLIVTPTLVPLLIFAVFILSDLIMAAHGASNAVPFGSIAIVALIWACISAPLSIIAGLIGFRRQLKYPPTRRVNQIARLEPPRPWYARTVVMMVVGGFVPFAVFSFQLKYVFSAIWLDRVFFLFGFLAFCAAGALVLSVMSGLLALYILLVNEFHHWQWRVFCVSGSSAIYVFAYSVWYLGHVLSLQTATGVLLYLAYSFLIAICCFLALGAAGSLVAYLMVRVIFDSIKTE